MSVKKNQWMWESVHVDRRVDAHDEVVRGVEPDGAGQHGKRDDDQ